MRALTCRAIRHAVMTLEACVSLSTDVHGVDGHRLVLVTTNGWLLLNVTSDALVLESPLQNGAVSSLHLICACET